MEGVRTTIKDSVDDFIRLSQRGLRISEGNNPSISCGFSRTHETELEQHAPTGVTDPFTSSFSEIKLDTANQSLIEL